MEANFPTEVVSLPSKGKLYPEDSPLHSGEIEMRYMSARDEDILTNQNFIEKGIVVDKLLQSLIADKSINYGDLLLGDKNALLVAARILGYGKNYEFEYKGERVVVDLSEIKDKPLSPELEQATENKFKVTLPISKKEVEFKLLTHADDQAIERELAGLRKMAGGNVPELTTRLKYMILSVDGETDRTKVRAFVDKEMLAGDSRFLRNKVNEIQPDVDMVFYPEGSDKPVNIPISLNFLYPDISF